MAFPGLQRFVLTDVRPTGKQLGAGSYGSVVELKVNGLVCAGKRLHDALLDRENAGVANIERRYLEECQVMLQIRLILAVNLYQLATAQTSLHWHSSTR